jgi:hypothetical protein
MRTPVRKLFSGSPGRSLKNYICPNLRIYPTKVKTLTIKKEDQILEWFALFHDYLSFLILLELRYFIHLENSQKG